MRERAAQKLSLKMGRMGAEAPPMGSWSEAKLRQLNRKTALFTGAAVVGAAVLMASLWWGLQHAALKSAPLLGRPAPALAIQPDQGQRVAVSSLRGQPVVLNFWASWCGPCAAELPVLSAAHQDHPTVAFVGADMQDTPSGEAQFERTHAHPYPAGPIVDGTYQAYGVFAPPVTVFINSDGLVVASFAGPLDQSTLDHYLGLISQ